MEQWAQREYGTSVFPRKRNLTCEQLIKNIPWVLSPSALPTCDAARGRRSRDHSWHPSSPNQPLILQIIRQIHFSVKIMPTSPPNSLFPSGFLKLDLYRGILSTAGSCQRLVAPLGTYLVAARLSSHPDLQFQTKLVPEARQAQGSSFSAVSKGFKVNTHMDTVK